MALKGIPKFGAGTPAAAPQPVATVQSWPAAQPVTPAPAAQQPAPPQTQPQAQAQPATGRRFSIGQAPANYGNAPTEIPDAPAEVKVSGIYHAYIYGVGENKKGLLQAKLKVHAPGEDVHGVGAYVDLAIDPTWSPGGQRFARKRIVEFFTLSGFPETRWPAGAAGGKVPPIVDLFTLPVDLDGGGQVRVPVMLVGEFYLEIDSKDNQKSYQRVKSAKMVEPYHSAPVMKYCDEWVAQMCGWPYSHGDYSAVVEREQLAADFADFGLFQEAGNFEAL